MIARWKFDKCCSRRVTVESIGKQAKPIVMDDETVLLAKPMEDGSLAVGLFNLLEQPQEMAVTWEQLGIEGKYRVRDVWRQQDIGERDNAYSAEVGRHGVVFVRMWPIQN